jgi:hypothetical protein
MIRSRGQGRTGRAGEWQDMDGSSPSPKERRGDVTSRTIKPKPLRRNSKRELSARACLLRLVVR